MKKLLACAGLAVLAGLAGCGRDPAAQESQRTQGDPAQGIVITNARILDGNGGVIERGTVVVRDGRIVSVGQQAPNVQGALQIDAQGMTVMPGFVDAHRHIIRGEPNQWLNEQAAARMQEYLDAGFTTVFSAGDPTEQILALRKRVADGEIKGPRIFAAGWATLSRPVGGGGAQAGGPRVDPARTDPSRMPTPQRPRTEAIPAEETRAHVQRLAEAGVDAVKTVLVNSPSRTEQQTLALIAQESKARGIPTITHAVSVEDTLAAVDAGNVALLVHTPHIGQLTEEQAKKIAGAGIPMVSTLGVFVPYFDQQNQPLFRDNQPFPWPTLSSAGQGPVNARLLWNAGITYGYGTDTSWLPKDSLAHELRALHLTFSAKDIVTILTKNAAAAIGKGDQFGTLEPGKLADIVLVDGDPLQDIYDVMNVRMVIKEGQVLVDKRS